MGEWTQSRTAPLTEFEIARIRALRLWGWQFKAISYEMGKTHAHIVRIVHGINGRHVPWWRTWEVWSDGRIEP